MQTLLLVFLLLLLIVPVYWRGLARKRDSQGVVQLHFWIRSIGWWGFIGSIVVELLWPDVPYDWIFYVQVLSLTLFVLSSVILLVRKENV